jgi:fatty-acyl-CoA synthase
VLAPIVYRLSTIFLPTISFLKKPTLWLELMHKHRATLSFAPNFAYARLAKRVTAADLERWDLSCVRMLGCGAEPIHGGTMRAFTDRMAAAKLRPEVLLPSYGMAEATLAVSFTGLSDQVRIDAVDPDACYGQRRAVPTEVTGAVEFVSCGRAFKDHEIGIFEPGGLKAFGEREIGEIRFRGPSVAAGYYLDEASTRATFGTDGWLRTGDLGYIADGELFISGREKDIVIVHGHNYYPQAIEWLAEDVAGVRKGNVAFSVPGSLSEEVVIVAETSERDPEARKALAVAVTRRVHEEMGLSVNDVSLLGPGEMPKTSSGKLQRRKTREQYLAGTLGSEGVRSPGSAGERLQLARHLLKSFFGRVRHRIVGRAKLEPKTEA